jgi:hypothetical protein
VSDSPTHFGAWKRIPLPALPKSSEQQLLLDTQLLEVNFRVKAKQVRHDKIFKARPRQNPPDLTR